MDRLILFDIDGTLLSGGPAKEAFQLALLETYETAGPIETWEFSGKTDPQIARELLDAAGLPAFRIEAGFPRLWERYLHELTLRLPSHPTRLLPGVAELLDTLEGEEGVALGLLTGNVMEGARLKLQPMGMDTRFAVGAFGSDHEERNELPPIALARASRHWDAEFTPERTVVVGDTPRDVECGRLHGTRTIAVATGRFDVRELEATGADLVVDDLTDGERVLSILLE